MPQGRRIIRFADADETRAEILGRLKLPFRLCLCCDARTARRTATARQFGQRIQRFFSAAEMIDKFAKGDGTDIIAADQP